jgi:Holliday junction DNA helicase RuvA
MLIERIRGQFIANTGTGIIIDVNGVGYGVELPLSVLCSLPPLGHELILWTYTYVREDAIRLFGFSSYEDRYAFEIILGLSGVGPKVALAILSTLSVSALRHAVASAQPQILEAVPGVGKRLAEKILLELKPKLLKLQSSSVLNLKEQSVRLDASDFHDSLGQNDSLERSKIDVIFDDVHSALENLGFKDKQIRPLIKKLREQYTGGEFQDVMREGLRLINKQPERTKSKIDKHAPNPQDKPSRLIEQELF